MSLLGCSDGATLDPVVPDASRTDLYITNFSAERITAVHVVAAGSGAWGNNWINVPIDGGRLYAYLGEVVSGVYDIRMVTAFRTVDVFGFHCVGNVIAASFPALESPSASNRPPA
jgi:hypothetical protein